MDKTEKVEFLEYNLQLKKRQYNILIPKKVPREVYVSPRAMGEDPFLDGNKYMYRVLKASAVALIRNPNHIIYIPSKSKYSKESSEEDLVQYFDVVLYCHNSQLRKSTFYKLKKMIPYTKQISKSINYSISDFFDYCKKEYEKYEYSNKYYLEKSDWNMFEDESIYFSEGSKALVCKSFVYIVEFLKEYNFEEYVRKNGYTPESYAFGFEVGYWSNNIYQYLRKHNSRWRD